MGFMGLHGGFLMGKMVNDTQRNDCIIRILMMRSFSLANVKQCEVYVGPMLRHLVGFMGLHGGFLMGKMVNDTQRNDCIIRILMMRSFPWPMLSNVRSMLGPC